MRRRIVLLILAAGVALGVAAPAEEAPAAAVPTPPPAPAAVRAEAGPETGARAPWRYGHTSSNIGLANIVGAGLALAILAVFLAGWKRGRFVSAPLILGLFALGVGFLGMVIGLIDLFTAVASSGGVDSVDFAEGLSKAMVGALIGLVVVICGGLLTWILHARDRHLDRLAAETAEDEEQEVCT